MRLAPCGSALPDLCCFYQQHCVLALGTGGTHLGAQLLGAARLRPRARAALCVVTRFVRHA